MDWDQIEQNWKRAKGTVKRKWVKLTDDDLNSINGQREQLEDIIHKRYGFAAEHVRKEVDDWLRWQGKGCLPKQDDQWVKARSANPLKRSANLTRHTRDRHD
jgi:uncharacterized protein YjbJ (UPF0337 family)